MAKKWTKKAANLSGMMIYCFPYQENYNEAFRVVDFFRIREKTTVESRTSPRF